MSHRINPWIHWGLRCIWWYLIKWPALFSVVGRQECLKINVVAVVLGPLVLWESTIILVQLYFGKIITFHFNCKMEQAVLRVHSLNIQPRPGSSCGLVDIASTASMYLRPALGLQNPSSKACTNLVFDPSNRRYEGIRPKWEQVPTQQNKNHLHYKGNSGLNEEAGRTARVEMDKKDPSVAWYIELTWAHPKRCWSTLEPLDHCKKKVSYQMPIAHEHWIACSAVLISLGQASPLMEM